MSVADCAGITTLEHMKLFIVLYAFPSLSVTVGGGDDY